MLECLVLRTENNCKLDQTVLVLLRNYLRPWLSFLLKAKPAKTGFSGLVQTTLKW